MPTYLYIDPKDSAKARATELGCGWMPSVPAQYAAAVAGRVPCAIVSGSGTTTILPEPTTPNAVQAAAAPIVATETAQSQAAAQATANADTLRQRAQAALAANLTFVNAAKPGTASAQASAAYDQAVRVTKECSAVIRLALGLLDDVSGT